MALVTPCLQHLSCLSSTSLHQTRFKLDKLQLYGMQRGEGLSPAHTYRGLALGETRWSLAKKQILLLVGDWPKETEQTWHSKELRPMKKMTVWSKWQGCKARYCSFFLAHSRMFVLSVTRSFWWYLLVGLTKRCRHARCCFWKLTDEIRVKWLWY